MVLEKRFVSATHTGGTRMRTRPFPAPWRRNSAHGGPRGAGPSCCARRLRRALRCALVVAAGAALAWGTPVHAQSLAVSLPVVSVEKGDNPASISEGSPVVFRLRRSYESDAAPRLGMAVSVAISEHALAGDTPGDMLAAGEAGTRQVTFAAGADAVSFTVRRSTTTCRNCTPRYGLRCNRRRAATPSPERGGLPRSWSVPAPTCPRSISAPAPAPSRAARCR